ncbi:uncharacterized protein B0H64DRAFT_202963 [Chaetomium fimeti]|uniref:J domain-containing protein n=1 Tax=Chaetomium fimeti TaxID=1854472 RepID=A0AAE0HAJ6_9PEZI|nr:hypothetical protein B0H64DRAFT_202963 [Chaetomium fimeti]
MLLNKRTRVLCPRSGVVSAFCATQHSTSIPATFRPQGPSTATPSSSYPRQRQSYASVHGGQQGDKHNSGDQLKWPTSANPTPYEVLGLPRDCSYTKARYFRLAKLYHPDRQHHAPDDGISHLTKLERYRLVVAANEILSNPQKKRMYDLYGFGWANQTDSQTQHREADRKWRHEPGNPSMNATWEDWEEWHQQRNGGGEKQEEVFTSNLGFMTIISVFLIIGTWSHMTRAGTNSVRLLDMQDQKHAAISQELRERRNQRVRLDREGRVESFLRQREFEKWGYDPPGHGLPTPGDSNTPD